MLSPHWFSLEPRAACIEACMSCSSDPMLVRAALEDASGKAVLPIGRSGPAYYAIHGSLALQLLNIERQADVCRTL